MRKEIKMIDGKFVVETFYGIMKFNSYQDALNFLKTQRVLKIERILKVA